MNVIKAQMRDARIKLMYFHVTIFELGVIDCIFSGNE